jgi:hypothetical protein
MSRGVQKGISKFVDASESERRCQVNGRERRQHEEEEGELGYTWMLGLARVECAEVKGGRRGEREKVDRGKEKRENARLAFA